MKRRPACCERTSAINTFSVSYHIRLFTCWRLLITLAAPPRRTLFNFKAQYFKSYRADMTPLKPAHQPADISSAGLKVAAGQISPFYPLSSSWRISGSRCRTSMLLPLVPTPRPLSALTNQINAKATLPTFLLRYKISDDFSHGPIPSCSAVILSWKLLC